ncbi:hypothetical protein [Agathobacter rectalis]|uniref:hypothetical protein n=1 Tax=Agathobacter rectalis TaxID=39491 RepID=UPI0027D31C6B|nr:hypothetical protein [Agathobacter rectalis]
MIPLKLLMSARVVMFVIAVFCMYNKKCILVWQVPVIEGEPYNPVEYAVHVRKAKKFAEALNRYFAEKNMDYNCVLDKSACSLDEIFSPQ